LWWLLYPKAQSIKEGTTLHLQMAKLSETYGDSSDPIFEKHICELPKIHTDLTVS